MNPSDKLDYYHHHNKCITVTNDTTNAHPYCADKDLSNSHFEKLILVLDRFLQPAALEPQRLLKTLNKNDKLTVEVLEIDIKQTLVFSFYMESFYLISTIEIIVE